MKRTGVIVFGAALVVAAGSVAICCSSASDPELVISPDTVEVMGLPGRTIELNDSRIEGVAQAPTQTPRVVISETHSENAGLWTYTYTVLVQSNSQLDVDSFTLQGLAPTCQRTGPTNWRDLAEWRGPDGVRWYARRSPLEEVVLSPYRIPAGESRVFVLRSLGAPGQVSFACEGAVADVVYATEEEASEAYLARGGDNASPFEYAETGTTIGPTGTNVGSCEGGGGEEDPPIILPPPHGGNSIDNPDSLLEFGYPQPNPHRAGRQTIMFRLARAGQVRIAVYDVQGRQVAEPMKERLEAGNHSMVWRGRSTDGSSLPAGTYYFQFFLNGRAAGSRGTVLLR